MTTTKTDFTAIKKGTPIWVSNNGAIWVQGLFAGQDKDNIYTFVDGNTRWTASEDGLVPWQFAKLCEWGDGK